MIRQLLLKVNLLCFILQSIIPCQSNMEKHTFDTVLASKSAILMDGESGRVLFEKNGDEFRQNASTTKILTCIIAIENCELTEEVGVSEYAAAMPEVRMGIRPGETYALKDLLYALMLESYNDCAMAIAEHISGSREDFSKLMNKKCEELGCKNTFFLTPNGLDMEEDGKRHGTTAKDLGKIMAYCIKNKTFLEITRKRAVTITTEDKKRSFSLNNHNQMLDNYQGMLSGKTGFTNLAGYCYVGAMKRNGRVFIVVLLGCEWPPNKNQKWKEAKLLLDYGDENYGYYECKNFEGILRGKWVQITFGKKDKVLAYVDLKGYEKKHFLKQKEEKLRVVYKAQTCLEAPVYKNQQVGNAEIYIEDELIARLPIRLKNGVERRNFTWYLKKNIIEFLLLKY